jgi:hypothetical protein
MQRVHRELKELSGEKNPLNLIADRLAAETRVICFDEFFVSDIADAMILGGLFEELFERGVSLVATSNIVPDGLYKDGLQRARFLPAIALLKRHTLVLNVDGGTDYRLRALEKAELYHFPLDAAGCPTSNWRSRGVRSGPCGRPTTWCGSISSIFATVLAARTTISSWRAVTMQCWSAIFPRWAATGRIRRAASST